MAAITGIKGSVTLANNAVAEVTSFNLEISLETLDTTHMDSNHNGWRTHMGGLKGWSGSFTTQTTAEITQGEAATIALATGSETYSGDVLITSVSIPVSVGDIVLKTVNFQGTGALSRA